MTNTPPVPHVSSAPLSETLEQVIEAARDKKAENLVVLDLRQADAFTDYFVICSGRSHRQVNAIVEGLEVRLKRIGNRPIQIEGTGTDWVLIDCFDFIVHVFSPKTRNFYSLERLWGNAVRIELQQAVRD